MPPRGVTSAKRKRQYEHIRESELKQGRSTKRAKQIAAATVNKERRKTGQIGKKTAGGSKKTGGSRTVRKTTSRTRKTSPPSR